MRSPARFVLWLLPLMLTACIHWPFKKHAEPVAPPVVTTTPAPKPATSPADLPASATTIPTQPLPSDSKPIPEPAPPKKPVKHKKSPTPPPPQSEQAANAGPGVNASPSVSAVGQLSSGDSSDLQQETVNSLNLTERELNGLSRQLSEAEQKTAVQIREFLKQARTALTSGDVDGAHTLAAKAKVLLAELNQ
jgi:outer membrane biosynthesis protein TonB